MKFTDKLKQKIIGTIHVGDIVDARNDVSRMESNFTPRKIIGIKKCIDKEKNFVVLDSFNMEDEKHYFTGDTVDLINMIRVEFEGYSEIWFYSYGGKHFIKPIGWTE